LVIFIVVVAPLKQAQFAAGMTPAVSRIMKRAGPVIVARAGAVLGRIDSARIALVQWAMFPLWTIARQARAGS
jgi:hypothetical protein